MADADWGWGFGPNSKRSPRITKKKFIDYDVGGMGDAGWGWGYGPNSKRALRSKRFRDFSSMADADWGWGFGPSMKRASDENKRCLKNRPKNSKYNSKS